MNLGEMFTRDNDHAGHLLGLDLVVDARESDRELVVGVADVREVRVYATHDLGGQMDVYVALRARVLIVVHGPVLLGGRPGEGPAPSR